MKRQTFYIKMVAGSLIRRRSRMLVALLAVAIGAAILSGLVTLYYDIPRQMRQEFRSYGANMILLPSGEEASISEANLKAAEAKLPEDETVGVAPYRYETAKINEQPFMAAGTDLAEAKKASPYWGVSGKWPSASGEVLIGQEVADTIGLVAGDNFKLDMSDAKGEAVSEDFNVTGILQTGGEEEAFVFLSLSDLEAMVGDAGRYDVVECSVSVPENRLEKIAGEIEQADAGVAPRLVKRVTQSEGTVLTKLQALVWLVTVIVLFLTMICVATTMMAVVAERRKEIGLRKALGASNRSIVFEFLGEGTFLGGVGGILGACLGFLFAQQVSVHVFGREVAFLPWLVPITLIASALITVFACLIPVRRATDIDPALVLKGE
jgi:putative ABC transport system permease protein